MQGCGKSRGGVGNRKHPHQPQLQTARILSLDGARFSKPFRVRKDRNVEKFPRQLRHRVYAELPSGGVERKQGRLEHEGRLVSDWRGRDILAHRRRARRTGVSPGRTRPRSRCRRVPRDRFPPRMNEVPIRSRFAGGNAGHEPQVRYGQGLRPERMETGRKRIGRSGIEDRRARPRKTRTRADALEVTVQNMRTVSGILRGGGVAEVV